MGAWSPAIGALLPPLPILRLLVWLAYVGIQLFLSLAPLSLAGASALGRVPSHLDPQGAPTPPGPLGPT